MDRSSLKKIVIAGGSGFVGTALKKHFGETYKVVVLPRARTTWANELDGAWAVINLAGKNVNCRYTSENKKEILESRVLTTKALGDGISTANDPPKIWIQMSSATIYRHSEDRPMDETHGEIGNDFSMNVCKSWERTSTKLS